MFKHSALNYLICVFLYVCMHLDVSTLCVYLPYVYTSVCVVCVCLTALNQKNTSIKKSQSGGMKRRGGCREEEESREWADEWNSDILFSHEASLCWGRADSPLLCSCRRSDSIWACWKSIYTNRSALIDNWKALCSLRNLHQCWAVLQVCSSTYSHFDLDSDWLL